MKRKLLTILICCLVALTLAFSLASCGDSQDNKETQSTKSTNSTENTDNTENKETDKKSECELNGHTYDNACDVACNECNQIRAAGHDYSVIQNDETYHWYACSVCERVDGENKSKHGYDNDCDPSCNTCEKTRTTEHTPNADDGDCTTDITCKDCGKVTTAGYKEHTPNADDGDCTTAIICQYCDIVTTEARSEHTGGTATCTHGKLCEVCGYEYDTAKAPDNHVFVDGVCACGELQTIDATEMTAEQLNAAVAELLASGVTDITIKMSADADMDMFTALRTALAESTAPDGSINLTISGAKTVPDEGFIDMLDYFENDDKNIAGDKLKSLTLTDVETIGEYAFSACTNLEAVNMPKVVTIGECAFNEWRKGTKLTSLDLPNATTIGECAFAYSSLLTSVNLPKVVTIGLQAFERCDIRTLDLPEVTEIGGMAFVDNYNLVSCSAPKATKIGAYPWGNCSKLETLELTAAGDITISNNYFANTLTGQINLVLNKDKESQVTQNDDGTATWNIKDGYGNFYTFKSITFACSDGTTNHDYQYTDNGDGTHDAVCSKCDYVKVDNEKHTAVSDGYDCICGATVIAVIDGTLGGKEEATEEDVRTLVDQLKAYVDNGITTIIVTGEKPAIIFTEDNVYMPAVSEALYRLAGRGYYDESNPYYGTIDLIMSDITTVAEWEFFDSNVLNTIYLPKVTTVDNAAFAGCYYLKKITFGSVVNFINQDNTVVFYQLGSNVGGCDLVLNCGQMQAEDTYKPDLENNVWFKPSWGGDVTWKSITLTHTGECDECKANH